MDTRKLCKNCEHSIIWVKDGEQECWLHGFIELGNWIDGGNEICLANEFLEGDSLKRKDEILKQFNKDKQSLSKKYERYNPILYINARCDCNKPEPGLTIEEHNTLKKMHETSERMTINKV